MSGNILLQWTSANAPSVPRWSTRSISIHLVVMTDSKDSMPSRDTTSRMAHGSCWLSSLSFLFQIAHASVHRRIRSSYLVAASALDLALLLNKLMSWRNNGSPCRSCQKAETWGIRYALAKAMLMPWVDSTPKPRGSTMPSGNGQPSHATPWVITWTPGPAACSSLPSCFPTNIQYKMALTF